MTGFSDDMAERHIKAGRSEGYKTGLWDGFVWTMGFVVMIWGVFNADNMISLVALILANILMCSSSVVLRLLR